MNKAELIDAIAKSSDISKASAGNALDGALEAIKAALKKGQTVTLVGFGTFKVGDERAARQTMLRCRTVSPLPQTPRTLTLLTTPGGGAARRHMLW